MTQETQNWTPTPWRVQCNYWGCNVSADDSRHICSTGGYSNSRADAAMVVLENEANASRIVAAVNATSSLSTESLENGIVTRMIEALRKTQEFCSDVTDRGFDPFDWDAVGVEIDSILSEIGGEA